jgi:Trypsin
MESSLRFSNKPSSLMITMVSFRSAAIATLWLLSTSHTGVVVNASSELMRPTFVSSMDGTCSASLLNPDSLLSAASCRNQFQVGSTVYIPTTGETLPVTAVRVHPEFRLGHADHDLMLIKMGVPSNSTSRQSLNSYAELPVDGAFLKLLDYVGDENEDNASIALDTNETAPTIGSSSSSNGNILELQVTKLSHDECTVLTTGHNLGLIDERMFCTSGSSSRECQGGLQGSPILDVRDIQVGVVTMLHQCGANSLSDGNPDVNLRVSAYDEWIRTSVCCLSDFAKLCSNYLDCSTPSPAPLEETAARTEASTQDNVSASAADPSDETPAPDSSYSLSPLTSNDLLSNAGGTMYGDTPAPGSKAGEEGSAAPSSGSDGGNTDNLSLNAGIPDETLAPGSSSTADGSSSSSSAVPSNGNGANSDNGETLAPGLSGGVDSYSSSTTPQDDLLMNPGGLSSETLPPGSTGDEVHPTSSEAPSAVGSSVSADLMTEGSNNLSSGPMLQGTGGEAPHISKQDPNVIVMPIPGMTAATATDTEQQQVTPQQGYDPAFTGTEPHQMMPHVSDQDPNTLVMPVPDINELVSLAQDLTSNGASEPPKASESPSAGPTLVDAMPPQDDDSMDSVKLGDINETSAPASIFDFKATDDATDSPPPATGPTENSDSILSKINDMLHFGGKASSTESEGKEYGANDSENSNISLQLMKSRRMTPHPSLPQNRSQSHPRTTSQQVCKKPRHALQRNGLLLCLLCL